MFDSGGYYVQQEKLSISDLLLKLNYFYKNNDWGDWYVLPDCPPVSSDNIDTVWGKVYDTVYCAKSFSEEFNNSMQKKFIPVVQGVNKEQLIYCITNYAKLNVKKIGFGSFGTCGSNNAVNRLTKESLENLKYVSELAKDYGFQLHAFGIGGSSTINKIRDYVDSFDSSGWDKAAGYGDVFLPGQRTINITGKSSNTVKNYIGYTYKFDSLRNGHYCHFCNPISQMKEKRIYRSLHNIMVVYDMIK
jgi:queuine/archaeosine tRNA-ribosyltransferase